MNNRQYLLIKKAGASHGGSIKNPQQRKRPLSTSKTMHLVLRSSKAKGKYSFKKHKADIDKIITRFANKYKIEILSQANVGNHLHFHIKIFRRQFYASFIRAICAAIMIKVTGFSRWNKKPEGFLFWDARPFTRIISAFKDFLNLKDYILLNQYESQGLKRWQARENLLRLKLRSGGLKNNFAF